MKVKDTFIRNAVSPSFMRGVFDKNITRWYPGADRLVKLIIAIQRNFLNEYRSVALKYTVTYRRKGKNITTIVRGQARAHRHEQEASPRKTYRVLSHLNENGFRGRVSRPLAFLKEANLLLYEETPGRDIESRLYPGTFRENPVAPPSFLPKHTQSIAEFLRDLHTIKHVPGAPVSTRAAVEKQTREHLRLLGKHHRKSVAPVKRILKHAKTAHPQYHRTLFAPVRRRLVHGDFHLGNVLLDGSSLRVIDFGDSMLHHPLWDIGRFLVQTRFLLKVAYGTFHNPIINQVLDALAQYYFRQKNVRPADAYAVHYFAVLNLTQMMAIKSFTSGGYHRDKIMMSFLDGLYYSARQIELLKFR